MMVYIFMPAKYYLPKINLEEMKGRGASSAELEREEIRWHRKSMEVILRMREERVRDSIDTTSSNVPTNPLTQF